MTTLNELRRMQTNTLAAIGDRFLREYDPETHDGTMRDLVAELDRVEKQISVAEMPL